ncbi:MAG: UDP-N-acetylmuramate dehydrogenase [Patescibacteria group bacterium]|jgi:UDP-N-acetylmuramate dehydrogenase
MSDKLIEKLGSVKENEPLASHTTFKIGGPAKYFYEAKNSQELLAAVKTAEELKIPFFILGWGSNMLVSDDGFAGLIIKTVSNNFTINGQEIWVEAGVNLSRLIGLAGQAGLTGLETMAGIPGTVGGTAFGNAGAYGVSFGKVVKEVEIYQAGEVKKLSQPEMAYEYRGSILKKVPGIILSVTVKLEKGDPRAIQSQVVKFILERNQKLPIEPSAGCIFKNIKLDKTAIDKERLKKELDIDEAEWQKVTMHGKLSAGYLIDRLDLRGKTIGGCQISEKHSNFFVNIGSAKAEHVIMLISDVKMRVRNQLGIQLEEEIRYLGF